MEPFYVRGFIVENPFSGITYHAVGVNGASVPSYLKCEYFENDLSFIKPDLCVFAIGINDASGDAFDTVVFKKLRCSDSKNIFGIAWLWVYFYNEQRQL